MANQAQVKITNAYTYEVDFTTTNLTDGSGFIEPHTVSGPTAIELTANSIPLNPSLTQSKVYIPLTTNTSEGAYYLAIYLPQNSSNPEHSSKMYVAFAQKAAFYNGGYYLFGQGMTKGYRAAFRNFCIDGTVYNFNQPRVFNKKVKFIVKGIETNNVSAAVEFQVWFRYRYTPSIIITPPLGNS